MGNKEIVQILKEALAAMEVKEQDRFRIRAYQNALSAIEGLTSSVYDLWQQGRVGEIPGVGPGLKQHLDELFTTGEVKEYKVLKRGLTDGMFSLIGIRGIGAKRAFKLATEFELNTRDEAVDLLKDAAHDGKIRVLDGFGEKSEADILHAIEEVKMTKNKKERLLLIHAEEIAERMIKYIKLMPGVVDAQALGSLRRRQATVGDIDLAVASDDGEEVIKHFLKYNEIAEVLAKGEKKASVVLNNETQVDLRVSEPDSYGSMLQYFTGNKQHNVVLRTYALENSMSLSEYGIKYQGKVEKYADEEAFYRRLGLPSIPPEIRNGNSEVELAIQGKLPKLITIDDIKGDLHSHTIASDGLNTLAEMVNEARTMGYQYIGISDHSPSILSRGYDDVISIIERQRKSIDSINEAQDDIHVLFGYEVNILADATLSLPEEILAMLDYVVASIHTSFNQDIDLITGRLLAAIENPNVTIIGHPSGRLINERESCDINWEKVFKAVLKYGKILEINSQPNRLDLADDLVHEAVRLGIKLVIDTDAHDIGSLKFMKYGIDVARRGHAERRSIINTLNYEDMLEVIKKA